MGSAVTHERRHGFSSWLGELIGMLLGRSLWLFGMGPDISGLVLLFDVGVLSGLRLAKPVAQVCIETVEGHFDQNFC